MKKNTILLLGLLIALTFQANAQVKLVGNWLFNRTVAYDQTVINKIKADAMNDTFTGTIITFDEQNVTFAFTEKEEDKIKAKYVIKQSTLILSDYEGSENYKTFLEDFRLTVDYLGTNDGKHFKLNLWKSTSKKPQFQLLFKKK